MRNFVLTAASVLALTFSNALCAQTTAEDVRKELQPGDDMPAMEITMKNATGRTMSLKEAGKAGENGTLVMFSCNTCPFVVKNQETTKKVMKYAAAHKVPLVIINSNAAQSKDADSYDAMKKYAKAQGYNVPYLQDENNKVADLFGASHTPEVYLFNKENKLVYKGAMNDNAGDPKSAKVMYVNNAIDNMMVGKDISPNVTKSIGCSIKRNS